MALRKATIAKEALRQLGGIVDMLRETGNWDIRGVEFHAHSANNYIKAIRAAGMDLPEIVTRNAKFLHVHGWRLT